MQHIVWQKVSWLYALTIVEEALATRIGFARQEPMLGQPERNRNYSEGDVWEAWQHMIAVGSEIAVARMLGFTDFVPSVNTFRSKEDIPGHEVRYSFYHNSGPKLRFNASIDNPEKKYILTAAGLELKTRRSAETGWKGNPYKALGWMYGRDCMNPDYLWKGKTYYVPRDQLFPMNTLPNVRGD
jgi:hypothetical protein